MLRSAMMVGVIALCCVGAAPSAEARSQGAMGFSHGAFAGRGFARFQSPGFGQRGQFFDHRRFFAQRRFFDRDRDDRFFFRDRFRFREGFGFGSGFGFGGFGGFPYYGYPYDTGYGGGYYPYVSAPPPEGPSPIAALPPPPTQVADLPPCRETGVDGVVILRGTACSHGKP